jgi:hypothetical protein
MSHERDHDHPPAPVAIPREPELRSRPKPDHRRREHPTVVPREPIDPRTHPSRR